MPGAHWFLGAELNYAEYVFRHMNVSRLALLFQSERQPLTEVSWQELRHKVGLLANTLRALEVQRGDRVVSCMPNIPETLIAFLATASLGAIWSSCSPDFGTQSVIDRFKQIEPAEASDTLDKRDAMSGKTLCRGWVCPIGSEQIT